MKIELLHLWLGILPLFNALYFSFDKTGKRGFCPSSNPCNPDMTEVYDGGIGSCLNYQGEDFEGMMPFQKRKLL
jgi:hypothetical protein